MAQTRLAVLDGLRGIAVLLVLWFHVWEISWLPAPLPLLQFVPETGFIGVDLFFFISGFVIVYPFAKALHAGDVMPTWGSFAYRRALKIVPSYVLSLAIAMAVGYAQFPSVRQAVVDIVTHLLFIHTWFADSAGSINGVLWTLAVEVEFYAVFPLLWFFFRRAPYVTAIAMMAAALLFRNYAGQCCMQTSAVLMLENLPSFFDTFAFGMIGAHVYVRYREHLGSFPAKSIATLAAATGFLLLGTMLHGLWVVRIHDNWPTFWEILNRTAVGGTFLLMGVGSLLALAWWQRIIANPALMFFAVVSYNLYLYHQMIARLLLKWRIPPYTGDEHLDAHWQVAYSVVAFAVIVVFSAAVTYGFERPILRLKYEDARAWMSGLRRKGVLPPV